jgi:hypothetical protein
MSERKQTMKFSQPFMGVPKGEFYPVAYQPGDECPPELLNAAKILGVISLKESKAKAE